MTGRKDALGVEDLKNEKNMNDLLLEELARKHPLASQYLNVLEGYPYRIPLIELAAFMASKNIDPQELDLFVNNRVLTSCKQKLEDNGYKVKLSHS